MGNDLQQFRPAFLKIQEDMERLNRAINPSYLKIQEQLERALEPVRRQHEMLAHSMALSGCASARLVEIAQANQRWQDMVGQAMATNRVVEDFHRTHQTWLENIKPFEDKALHLQAAANLSLGDMAFRLTAAERIFAGIDLKALQKTVVLPEPVATKFVDVIAITTASYKTLADSISTTLDVTHLPTFALPGATREVFTSAYALRTFNTPGGEEIEENILELDLVAEAKAEVGQCITLLDNVDPALSKIYIGARDALNSANADRARHILASLRELWNHLLRRIAPDEAVLDWSPEHSEEYIHRGRPTRKARLLYTCRGIHHGPLTDFVIQDTRALVRLLDLLNRVHELEPNMTDSQLEALFLRTESWLTYILRISETGSDQ